MNVKLAGLALFLTAVLSNDRPAALQRQNLDDEQEIGQQVFDELRAKGEIVASSPLYDKLKPIADAIARVAQPQYQHPIVFHLVHEQHPNAFATPGGNVYVTDS